MTEIPRRTARLVKASVSGDWFPSTCVRIVHVPRKCLDVDGLYESLGADPSMTCDEIRSEAKKRLIECHPDTGGDTEEFISVHRAYEVLCDEASRAEYDARKRPDADSGFFTMSVSVPEAPEPSSRPCFWKEPDTILTEDEVELVYQWIDLLVETAVEFGAELDVQAGACRYPLGYSVREEKAMIGIGIRPEKWGARLYVLREMSKK